LAFFVLLARATCSNTSWAVRLSLRQKLGGQVFLVKNSATFRKIVTYLLHTPFFTILHKQAHSNLEGW